MVKIIKKNDIIVIQQYSNTSSMTFLVVFMATILIMLLCVVLVPHLYVSFLKLNEYDPLVLDTVYLPTMKIAVCVSGQLRDYKSCIDSLEKYLIHPFDVDVFLVTDTNYDALEDYDPVSYEFIDSTVDNMNTINGMTMNSMFYKIYKCNQLKLEYERLHRFKYDIVIRTRPDIVLYNLPFHSIIQALSIEPENTIYVPKICNVCGYIPTDQIAIGSSKNIDIYSDSYLQHHMYYDTYPVPEEYLQFYLERNDLRSIHKPYSFWSVHEFTNTIGFYKKVLKKIPLLVSTMYSNVPLTLSIHKTLHNWGPVRIL